MSKQVKNQNVLDIEREYQLCSVVGKRTWNETLELINELARERGLTEEQVYDLKQRKMAVLRYSELKEEIDYLSRTQESNAARKIDKNKLEIAKMSRIYAENGPKVANTEPALNEKLTELANKKHRENEQKQVKKQKTGK